MVHPSDARSMNLSLSLATESGAMDPAVAEHIQEAFERGISFKDMDGAFPNFRSGDKPQNQVDVSDAEFKQLYQAIADRYKWFHRVYVSDDRKTHVSFLDDTVCSYSVNIPVIRIPGTIRGPDYIEGKMPDEYAGIFPQESYLVPVHQVADHGPYHDLTSTCTGCTHNTIPTEIPDAMPHGTADYDRYKCPNCGKDARGISFSRYSGLEVIHVGDRERSSYCEVDESRKYEFMDWMLNTSPGHTARIPPELPMSPTTVAGGYTVSWVPGLEPITQPPFESQYETHHRFPALVQVDHDDFAGPVAITNGDWGRFQRLIGNIEA